MSRYVYFTVPGPPVPKGRPRFGNGRAYTPKRTADYERAVREAAKAAGVSSSTAPCGVSLHFALPDARNRDLDNLAKAVTDALNKGLAYEDDGQIVELYVTKAIDRENPHARVRIRYHEPSDE